MDECGFPGCDRAAGFHYHQPLARPVRVRDYSKGFNDRCDVCGARSRAGVCRGCESEGLG